MNWDRWLGSQAQILPHPKNEWHSPWPHLYARCSVLATLLSYSRACWGSHHLRAKIPMSHSGIRGPPGSQLAPQVDSWWWWEPALHALSTTTSQGPQCHSLSPGTLRRQHTWWPCTAGGRQRQWGETTCPRTHSQEVAEPGSEPAPTGLKRRCPHFGLLSFPEGRWAERGWGTP